MLERKKNNNPRVSGCARERFSVRGAGERGSGMWESWEIIVGMRVMSKNAAL